MDLEEKQVDLELATRLKIASLSGSQARIALLCILEGKSLVRGLMIALSYPRGN